MKQINLCPSGFELLNNKTRKLEFLEKMNVVLSLAELVSLIKPHATKNEAGRMPFVVSTRLRIHFVQQCFNLSDLAMEKTLHNVSLHREFTELDAGASRSIDGSTILRFLHLLEKHELSSQSLCTINATLLTAPKSTKYSKGECDLEMHQAEKENQWFFGMRVHIDVDADAGQPHTDIGTAANVNDVTQRYILLHGEEKEKFADAGYQGANKRPEVTDVTRHLGMRPGKRNTLDRQTKLGVLLDNTKKLTVSVPAKVGHPLRVIKHQFGFTKVLYSSPAKNTAKLVTLFALSNFWLARRAAITEAKARVRTQSVNMHRTGPIARKFPRQFHLICTKTHSHLSSANFPRLAHPVAVVIQTIL